MAIFVLAPQLCVDILVQQVKEACFVAAAEIPLMILQSRVNLASVHSFLGGIFCGCSLF